MTIIQGTICISLVLCGIFLIRTGGILFQKAGFYKGQIKSGSSIFEILSMQSMLIAILLMKHSDSIISLCLLIICLVHNEVCWLVDENTKKRSKILSSIATFIGIIIYTLLFLNHENTS